MNIEEILRAVQAGKMNFEKAAEELRIIMKDAEITQPKEHSPETQIQQDVVYLYEVEPGIVQVTMQDSVNKNTFSYELVAGLFKAFEFIQANSNYKVVILTGYDTYFASGGTKEALLNIYEGKTKFTDSNIYSLALDCKIPVIAAMQGHAIGAGWSMGMFCDLIVMSLESTYTSNYIQYGFTPGAGATLIFPEKLGICLSQEIFYTAQKYHGSELKAMGIPFPVLPRKDVISHAIRLAKKLAESPRETLIALKDLMAESIRAKVSLSYEKELKMHEKTFVNQPVVKERIQSIYGEALENGNPMKSSGLPVHGEKEVAVPGDINMPLQSQNRENSIAIIGMAGQFPKAKNIAEFWDNVAQGKDCVSEIPKTRWSIDDYYDPDPEAPGKTYCKYMGALEDVAKFDPLFFGISPAEAEVMDPQQRLFLESCWSCIEDAGLTPSSLSGSRCGVFVGCGPGDYGYLLTQESGHARALTAQTFTGGALSILAARISYLLNLKGPCLAIETACSSSTVAIAEACDSLILQNSDLALAGGVNVMAGPGMHIQCSKTGMLSPDGRCYTFDGRANGFVPGEGVGVVLLKRLSEAVRDHDPIYAVIRGWGVNQDGKTNGITAPSVNSQILLEKEVYQRFGINPETIGLVETHGTATQLGDPIEVEALTESFQSFTQKKKYCALGTVKSNIGHLLLASGVASVIKTVLALQHRMLPPTINFETLNKHISLDNTPFFINTKLQPWEVTSGTPRRACVSSFGFSGTNAHIVIEEYHSNTAGRPIPFTTSNPQIFVLSAKSEEQLKTYANSMKSYVESHADLNLADMIYTLQVGREAMEHRLAFLADSRETLVKVLEGFINDTSSVEVLSGRVIKSEKKQVEDPKTLLQTLISEKKLKEVAELWIKGRNIDWEKLYGGIRPRRKNLPTYPFAREYYWLPNSKTCTTPGTLMLHPAWREKAIAIEALAPEFARHLVMLCEPKEVSKECIETQINGVRCFTLESEQKGIGERFTTYAIHVFKEIQRILKDKPMDKVLFQVVVFNQEEQQLFTGISGLLKTARLENPQFMGQLIEMEPGENSESIIEKLKENSRSLVDYYIRYRDGKRLLPALSEIENVSETIKIPWKDRGVYMITGGAGGLGLIFAREIASKAKDVTLILTGRSSLSESKKAQLKELQTLGAIIEYMQIDVTQMRAVAELIHSIRENFGRLNGIIHCAGMIRDNFILKKTKEEFLEVLAPKINGLVNLDEASKDLPIDFFVLFSSIAGVIGNLGQADYAVANAFMDAYAKYRNSLVTTKKRQGQTLSIDWPLWQEGGMRVDKEIEEGMRQSIGMISMQTSTGIGAFYQGLDSGKDQVMVIEGELKRLRATLLEQTSGTEALKKPSSVEGNNVMPTITQDLLSEKATNYFKKLFSSVTKLPPHRIEADTSLEKYGINSIIAMQLTIKLEKKFGPLSKTLLFEYQNIKDLTGYFLKCYRNQLMEILGIEEKTAATIENSKNFTTVPEPKKMVESSHEPSRFATLRTESREEKSTGVLDIAIIGVSGRYPGARTIQEFWRNLQDGKDCIIEIPKNRWDNNLYFGEKDKPGKIYCKWGGFLDDVDKFDPLFFNLSPREAEIMDPMCRLFLENVWHLFENAGYTRETLHQECQSRVGVFVGASYQQYRSFNSDILRDSVISISSNSSIANRVSHYFNLQGPSMAIDTMCSSSTIAIHTACESLKGGNCRLAIAGGVNLTIHPKKYLGLSLSRMIGSHTNSRSFGDGDGFLPAEGVGAVLLKPLAHAIRDRNFILAVIKSTATNHGGHSNGYTVPNPNAQAQLIEENFIKSKIDPRTVSYVESAANGSALGDPIEVTVLCKTFNKFTTDRQFCAIGSVKSNIGHAEAASGISQLTKVILQLQHRKLVPSIKADPLNPNITFDNTPFYLQRELQEWKRPVVKINGEEREYPRRATVSSFGAGGSNAHLIVEEYISVQEETVHISAATSPQIMVFSARNRDRLLAVVEQMQEFVERQIGLNLPDFAYTLQVGREAMEYRLAMVVNTREELMQGLKESLKLFKEAGEAESSIPVFTGNPEEDLSNIKKLHSGKIGEAMMQMLLEEKDLEKIALYWTQGGKISWKSLHEGQEVHKISLPNYPFEKRCCWIEYRPEPQEIVESTQAIDNNNAVAETHGSLKESIVKTISRALGMTDGELNINNPLNKYGVDSIVYVSIFRQLELMVGPLISLDELLKCRTTQDIINMILSQTIDNPMPLTQQTNISIPTTWPQFPELIHLNKSNQGRPVFWFHGGLGGVEAYQRIAQLSGRPFYGIQARGWMTDHPPLQGVPAMAAYYLDIIKSVQPEGPYDLGGYSLGGILAYEITRLLQTLGQTVDSIVMLDSTATAKIEKNEGSDKIFILQTINMALTSTIMQEPEKTAQTLIHRDEVNANLNDEAFLKQLINLAKKRGLSKSEAQLYTQIQQNAKVQQAYKGEYYSIPPLPAPHAVTCYYFRNKSGLYLGELTPYYTMAGEEPLLDGVNYWEEWAQQLPNFNMVDVDSPNHMMLLAEPKSFEVIAAFCEKFYSSKISE